MRWGLRGVSVVLIAGAAVIGAVSPAYARLAYIVNDGSGSVSVFDTEASALVGAPIPVPNAAGGAALSPDGRLLFVNRFFAGDVMVIDTATRQPSGPPIDVPHEPNGIAISPDGRLAYVSSGSNLDAGALSIVDLASRKLVGDPIEFGHRISNVALNPDGRTAYVFEEEGRLQWVDLASRLYVGLDLGNGGPIAVTPDGRRLVVVVPLTNKTLVVDAVGRQVIGGPIEAGGTPVSVAISPNGSQAYVSNRFGASISIVDVNAPGPMGEILVGENPESITFDPGGRFALLTRRTPGAVLTIDTGARQLIGAPIETPAPPGRIVVTPNQAPVASFTSPGLRPRAAGRFDASASTDPEGGPLRYDWDFGDGKVALNAGPTPAHAYADPGHYRVTLTVTDEDGCSVTPVFTGHTLYCNGSPTARAAAAVVVAGPRAPSIRIRCPRKADGRTCRLKVRAVARRKTNGKTRIRSLSATSRKRVRRGRAATVRIRPKPRFAARLATARRLLIRVERRSGGSKKVYLRRFRVVGAGRAAGGY